MALAVRNVIPERQNLNDYLLVAELVDQKPESEP